MTYLLSDAEMTALWQAYLAAAEAFDAAIRIKDDGTPETMAAFEEAQSAILEAHTVDLTGIAIKLAVLGRDGRQHRCDQRNGRRSVCRRHRHAAVTCALIIGSATMSQTPRRAVLVEPYERPRLRLGPFLFATISSGSWRNRREARFFDRGVESASGW